MNKQEKEKLISFIEKEKENITLKHGKYSQTHFGFIWVTKLIEFIEQLDEPKKVKAKQFVADWFEEHKHDLSNSLWEFTVKLNEKTNVTGAISEFESWFLEHPCAYEFITSMKNGYEVEEEPKWVVKIEDNGSAYFVDFFDELQPHLVYGLSGEVMRFDSEDKANAIVTLIECGAVEKVEE